MDAVRQIASVGNALRKQARRRVRLPLSKLTVVTDTGIDARALAALEQTGVRVMTA